MNKKYKYHFIILILTFQGAVFAQYNDFESWTDIGLKKKVNNKLSFNLEESVRLNHNMGSIKSFNTDIGAEYIILRNFELGITYRLSMRKRSNGYFSKHRGNIDVVVKNTFNQLKINFRNRSQLEKDTYINEQTDLYARSENRNKLKILYNIRGIKTDPFFAVETFHKLSQWNSYKIIETRYQFGFTRRLPNNFKINLAVIYKKERNETSENAFILNISLRKSI